jgi:very-short-patch-repair endonuclease
MLTARKVALRVNGVQVADARVRRSQKGPELLIADPGKRCPAMTRTHKRFSDALRGKGIQHRNEVRLRATNWDYAYVADIYIRERQVAVEIDGPSHIGQEWRDRIRDAKFRQDLGIRTIRLKHSEIEGNEDRVARKLDRVLRYR